MRIVYMGTPDFAVLPLRNIIKSGMFDVVAVVTNPDKPVGRKQVLTPSAVKRAATELNIPVLTYKKIREEGVEDLIKLQPDVIVTCAFGQILSKQILDIPTFGVINIHASLLPKYRGASPIHYAILNGEKQTGVTIMKTDVGIDTGDIITQKTVNIGEDETCGELFDKLSVLGAEMVVDVLQNISDGKVKTVPQPQAGASSTKMIKKEDAQIDWNKAPEQIKNIVRAFNPSPVAYTFYKGQPLKIFKVKIAQGKGELGEVIKSDGVLEVACKNGSVLIEELQKSGGKVMKIADFLRGNHINVGEMLVNG